MSSSEFLEKGISERIMRNGKSEGSKRKIGVMVAGISGSGRVVVGFSLCNKKDRYNYPGGVYTPGFDKEIASQRALKWEKEQSIAVPESIKGDLIVFLSRCLKYYKGEIIPAHKFNIF